MKPLIGHAAISYTFISTSAHDHSKAQTFSKLLDASETCAIMIARQHVSKQGPYSGGTSASVGGPSQTSNSVPLSMGAMYVAAKE